MIQHKWEAILNINKTTQEWEQIYKICFKTLPDNYLIYQQYKIINQILGTRSLQYKMSITKDKQCSFCKEHEETLMHLFFDCDQVFLLLQVLYDWILNKTNIQIILNKTAFILGYTYPLSNQIPINTINMITKSYIFHCESSSFATNWTCSGKKSRPGSVSMPPSWRQCREGACVMWRFPDHPHGIQNELENHPRHHHHPAGDRTKPHP